MKTSLGGLLLMLLYGTCFSADSAKSTEPSAKRDASERLVIQIVKVDGLKITLRIENKTEKEQNIWKPGSSAGDSQFRFVFRLGQTTDVETFCRSNVYSPDFAIAETIGPLQKLDLTFNLADEEWRFSADRESVLRSESVTASLKIDASEETKESRVTTGIWTSLPFRLKARANK